MRWKKKKIKIITHTYTQTNSPVFHCVPPVLIHCASCSHYGPGAVECGQVGCRYALAMTTRVSPIAIAIEEGFPWKKTLKNRVLACLKTGSSRK